MVYPIVLSSGMDGEWGMTGQYDLEAALDEKYHIPSLTSGIITVKTRDQIVELLEDPYYEIVPQAAIATDNSFSAAFNTTGAQSGTYTVKANDGYGCATSTSLDIIAEAPP